MRYLITGGCGFLGSNIAAFLLEKREEVIVFDNLSRYGSACNLQWLKKQGLVYFIYGDIRNREDTQRVVQETHPDVVYHFSGQVAMTTSIKSPRLDFETNVIGTFNVLESIRVFSPETVLIYSSTNKVYGDIEWTHYDELDKRYVATDFPNGFPETIPLDFHSPYGTSKGSADQYVLDYARIFKLKTAVFRHSSMYGSRQFATYDQGWVGWFVEQTLKQKVGKIQEPFTISGNGKQVRDLLYVDDMVRLYTEAVNQIDNICGQAFNIGGGMSNSLSLLELFDLLNSELQFFPLYRQIELRISDQKVFVADNTKITSRIGWNPLTDKVSGIHKMMSWIEEMKA